MSEIDPERLLKALRGSGNITVTVNAGGWGVSIAVGCCVVMLVIAGFMARDAGDARLQLREHGHQLNAIYRVAPSVEREVRARLEEDARLRAQASE
jgi:hypothetical protein